MKVSVPFEFDMDERFGIALEEAGELRLANREECRNWIHKNTALNRVNLRGTVAKIKKQFDLPAVEAEEE